MKLKKWGLGALALWLLSFVGVSLLHWSRTNAMNARYRTAVELGEKLAPLPNGLPESLGEACKAKLQSGGPNTIASYVAKMETLPPLAESYWHVDRTLLGVSDVGSLHLADRFIDGPIDDESLAHSFIYNANPFDWSRHLAWAANGSPQFADVRYLVVARYGPITMPRVMDTTFIAGSGWFGARVLRFPSGEVLCEGTGAVRMRESVSASGRGQLAAQSNARNLVPFVFTDSVTRAPLAEVCGAGGTELCRLTSEWVSPQVTVH